MARHVVCFSQQQTSCDNLSSRGFLNIHFLARLKVQEFEDMCSLLFSLNHHLQAHMCSFSCPTQNSKYDCREIAYTLYTKTSKAGIHVCLSAQIFKDFSIFLPFKFSNIRFLDCQNTTAKEDDVFSLLLSQNRYCKSSCFCLLAR